MDQKKISIKICKLCKLSKKDSEFYKSSPRVCKKCLYIKNKDYLYNWRKTNVSGKYLTLVSNAKRKNIIFCTKKEFIEWYTGQNRECVYCRIPEEYIEKIKWLHSYKNKRPILRLTIDRKDSKLGYQISNLCLACMICNIHKNTIFSHDEFLDIAKKYITPKWKTKYQS